MLWNKQDNYTLAPFQKEIELEQAVDTVKEALFGSNRIYLDDKRKIGAKGKTRNLPDGYLIDLGNPKEPILYVVENDLASHHHIKHIAVQILEFSLSYEDSKLKVKNIVKESLRQRPNDWALCDKFAKEHGYGNVDFLLESIVQKPNSFNALLIIDEVNEELETVLMSKFNFPVEIITLRQHQSDSGGILYEFEPFLYEISSEVTKIEVDEIDTIVVPAREEGFKTEFLGNHVWWSIRLSKSMIPKIKYLATYQVAPISAITHIAEVDRIERYQNTNKYILYFTDKPKKIEAVKLGQIKGKAPQNSRYTSKERLLKAKSLDEVF